MRFLSIAVLVVLSCQSAHGQPAAKELIANFRKTVRGTGPVLSTPFLIHYRGERYLYSLADGRLQGQAYDFKATLLGHTDTPHKHRKEMEMKIGIVPFKVVEVVDGDTGWYQHNDGDPVMMSKTLIDGRRQREIHVEVFLGHETFEPGEWQFSETKAALVQGQEAWQFDARTSGLEPITLTFAKKSGVLLRMTTKASDVALLPGAEAKAESFTRDLHFYDWKKVGPRMLPGHLDAFHDGVLWKKMEPVSISFPKTIDAKLFAMPELKK